METIILMLLVGILILLAFLVGARTAQKACKGEEIKLPNINPIKAVEEHREKVEFKEEQEAYNTMLENINNYDGTALGQKDIK